ncbi:hypothetical protein ABMA27_005843 [Loxostege sticticalis]|uniref:Uncharacterized protein n=1 Tax=Loxostege sticticalis TaxID=481309 RepID=A0ABR3HGP3_LOXSC
MRLIFWVTALAVLSITHAKNSTAKAKPKRQLDSIRSPHNLQYSLVLPHSRVSHFRALTSSRRISNATPKGGKLPPYAVQMEPVVQYSQKDPLYDPNLDNLDDAVVNKNELNAQPKIINIHDSASEGTYNPPFGTLPTAPLYSQEPHPHYYEAPEPIIEIIIKESNETLPAPPPQPVQKKKKEPVQVFYVKYSKDPHSKDKVVYEKPIPAITPPSNHEDDHHEEYVTVTPEPIYVPAQTTTLRAIIKPESEVYHSDSSVKVTFGSEGHHYSDRRESNTEDHEETAPRPAIAFPNQPNHQSLERSVSPKPQHHEPAPRQVVNHPAPQSYRQAPQHAQSRIQFQSPFLANEQQLPRQGPSVAPFRPQTNVPRQIPFGPTPSFSPQPSPHPSFSSNSPGPINHFGPTVSGPPGPSFAPSFSRPNSPPSFHPRPNSPPTFGPRPHFSGPPRSSFHSGPQRPFNQPHPQHKQPQPFFDEAKYLQENYHTITTDQIEPAKDQQLPGRHPQNFNFVPQPSPSPTPAQFHDHNRQPIIPVNQQLPQQRPPQHFTESQNKPTFSINPSRPQFFNLKPSPPQIENNRQPFAQQHQPQHQPQHPPQHPPQQQFSFHQGPQPLPRPTQIPAQHNLQSQHSFSNPISASPSPSPIPQHQFLPQPSSPPLFNFHPQPSPTPEQHFHQPSFSTERPQFQQPHGPSERPLLSRPNSFQDQSNLHHQQNVGQFVPNGGELVAAIPKYEQHITVNGPNAQTNYNGFSESLQPSPSPSPSPSPAPTEQSFHHLQQQQQQQQQQQLFDAEQEQVRLQLAQNVQKQQEEIQRLQTQLLQAQQQQKQQQQNKRYEEEYKQQQQQKQYEQYKQQEQNKQYEQYKQEQYKQQEQKKQYDQYKQQQQNKQYQQDYDQLLRNYDQQQQQIQASTQRSAYSQSQERSRPQPSYSSSTSSPPYYQSTSRTVEIKPTTQKYVSSTANSINSTPEAKKEEKKKKPTIELPDEVPDDLRQQLLSSGILDNADISVLDYDKVGDTPLESLPPDQLANFFSAGGAQQIASSELRPIVVKPNGDSIESRIDEDVEEDQEIAASENVATYVAPPPSEKQAVEMKVVHFDPKTAEGQNIAKDYVKDDATQVDPVALNDKKYNRYLPLKVSGNQFPLPDILKGRKVTSVVVLAPVETEALNGDHVRKERETTSLKGIKFVAGDSLQDLLKKPTKDNFQKWLDVEKKTATDLQSVILLVTGTDEPSDEREIFMYDITSGNVNKLSGELSNAFVEAAENNSLSKDIEKLAIEGEGTPENFNKNDEVDETAEGSENVPLFLDLSDVSLDQGNSNQVSISSGYSKMKLGRSLRRHS